MLERDPKNIFYYQRDVESYTDQVLTRIALHTLERSNYGGKSPVSIKYKNLHTFKEGLILLSQSILETGRITHLHGSAHYTIPLRLSILEN